MFVLGSLMTEASLRLQLQWSEAGEIRSRARSLARFSARVIAIRECERFGARIERHGIKV